MCRPKAATSFFSSLLMSPFLHKCLFPSCYLVLVVFGKPHSLSWEQAEKHLCRLCVCEFYEGDSRKNVCRNAERKNCSKIAATFSNQVDAIHFSKPVILLEKRTYK